MTASAAAPPEPGRIEELVERILCSLTLKEKISLLSGRDDWRTAEIPRAGVNSLVMTDGPHGVRAPRYPGRIAGPATSFPTGVAMASSWDPDLIARVGAALGEETRAMGCDVLLGPCVNIIRVPVAGRNFESYSEDPYLAGRIGAAYVKGLQSRGVGACVKHYACNNQEHERNRGSSEVDERTLREIYLAQFETIVKEARPWMVMCSYNRINGTYASQHRRLLTEILKGEWGFDGAVVSDWGANHTVFESVWGGLDLEMPGPARYYGPLLVDAVRNWQISEEAVDEAARRVLRLLARAGKLSETAAPPAGAVNTPAHQHLARELAEESMVLLKNDGAALPLLPDTLGTLAVIGPNAVSLTISGGGSARLEPPYTVSPLAGLKAALGDRVRIEYEQGCTNHVEPPVLGPELLGGKAGITGRYYRNTECRGEPDVVREESRFDFWWWGGGPAEGFEGGFSACWSGRMTAENTGPHTFALSSTGRCRFYLDGQLRLEIPAQTAADQTRDLRETVQVDLTAGRVYEVKVEYVKGAAEDFTHVRLGVAHTPADGVLLARAAALARRADAAVVFVGMPEGFETEGADRPHLSLPGGPDELGRAVAAANKRTIVVLNSGAPVTLPWLEEVPAVLLAHYPGQEGGHAVASILTGAVNPSGRLTATYPRRLADNPSYTNYPGGREVRYGEGIFVGYRYYEAKDVTPLFPFGHGLSYTDFAYGDLRAPSIVRRGEPVEISLMVKNIGRSAGKEVVQLYVADKEASLPRPVKELKGFVKVALAPGEEKAVRFILDERAFSFYHPYRGQWVAEPGEFEILAGSSSADIRARASLKLAE
ncbi:MAG: glycoside hydrolase family 3 C-terminal domain-containing protein [Bacteroidota bacterium]